MNTLLWLLPLALLAWLLLRNRGASPESMAAYAERSPQRVDVRTHSEYLAGHAPGSLHIPLDQLSQRVGELDRARPVLVACATGSRSAAAVSFLKEAGFEAVNAGSWRRLEELP
jgi:rhodanese-related sulfurtransferase